MKNLFLTLLLLAAVPVVALAQAGTVAVDDPLYAIYFSVTALAAIVLPITGWVKSHVLKTAPTQLLSWIVALALAFAGYALQLGIFAGAGPIWTAIYGLAAGLTANGVADITIVQSLLVAIGARVPKTK